MPFPSRPGFNFDDILNLLARASGKEGTPTPSAQDSYQYFWGDHPEKNRTAMARYERFGGQADPLGGEIGREQAGYMSPMPNQFTAGGQGDAINRLPIKLRQKYFALMGRVMETPEQGSWR